jgi:hypothetical protein
MNDRSDLEFLVTDWLRAAAPARAPDRVLASTLSRVADVGQTRPFGGRRFDDWIGASPRLHWAIVGALLAAALLGAVAGVGALLRREVAPKLDLAPPADLQAFVLSTYDRMPQMPPVAITTLTDGSVKGRMYVDRSGAVRFEHFATQDAPTPDTYKILNGTTMGQLAIVGSTKEWVQQEGAISEDPRVFLLAEMEGGAADYQHGCGLTRNDGEIGNGTAASGWTYVDAEYVIGRPTFHVSCAGGDLWIDVQTRLILLSEGPARNGSFEPVPGSSRTIAVTDIQFGVQPADLFVIAQPAGVASVSSDAYQCQLLPAACATPEPAPPTPRPGAILGPLPSLGPSRASNGWIAFSTQRGCCEVGHDYNGVGGDIYLARDGVDAKVIVSRGPGNASNVCPAFSPDGRTLVYGHRDGAGRALILLAVSADGSVSETARLNVPGDSQVPCPRWSADGTRLAYLDGLSRDGKPTGQPASLVVRGLDGSTLLPEPGDPNREDLTPHPVADPWPPLPSPSGELFAFVDDRGVMVERPDESDAHVLLTLEDFARMLGYSRDESVPPYSIPAWSPDGKYVLAQGDVSGLDFAMVAISVESPTQSIVLAPMVPVNCASCWPGRGDASWQPVFGGSTP